MKKFLLTIILIGLIGCKTNGQKEVFVSKNYIIEKSDELWKKELPNLSYYVLRKAYTETAFSGKYDNFYEKGYYLCKGCNSKLYDSENKYDSGSGWPSFDRGNDDNIEYSIDYKLGYPRVELKCNKCGGHLGHMFEDGPRETTGKRHCINSAALKFIQIKN
tara:strand:+ start:111 stop:593 length:483 start_codon:yes stop_codon:yes gene_type:complete